MPDRVLISHSVLVKKKKTRSCSRVCDICHRSRNVANSPVFSCSETFIEPTNLRIVFKKNSFGFLVKRFRKYCKYFILYVKHSLQLETDENIELETYEIFAILLNVSKYLS